MTVQPFEINIERDVLDDLRDRLRGTRWPDEIEGAGWDYGMSGSVLRSFGHTWLEGSTGQSSRPGSTSTRISWSTSTDSACTPCTPKQPTVLACRW
jgi:Epoxide hydrolase N terminus